ncbi:MAG: helix-turn-helix domain-containing protein [Planctomycetota bacterium]|nr:helix-turn-helix domain-containing protein [Planctomycetota bacterium]
MPEEQDTSMESGEEPGLNIGMEIKILRERKRISGKDLAERIGLSQSQMSRLEKGQRRIDAQILHKIARALDVRPSFFFGERGIPEEINLGTVHRDIGKMIRTERRKRHLSAEDLAKKISKPRSFILAVEGGEANLLNNEVVSRFCRALKIEPSRFFEAQEKTIQDLRRQVRRLGKAHADRTLGALTSEALGFGDAEAPVRRPIPILGELGGGYPAEFGPDGEPMAEVDDYLFVPRVQDEMAFALHVVGEAMERKAGPSFREGDIVVFSGKQEVRSKDFVFVHAQSQKPIFRQVFFDPPGVRMQPLNLSYPPQILHRDEVLRMWRLVAHLHRH